MITWSSIAQFAERVPPGVWMVLVGANLAVAIGTVDGRAAADAAGR